MMATVFKSVPTPAMMPREERVTIARSWEYKRGSDNVNFKQEIKLYIEANSIEFKTAKVKILFVLLFLKEGCAATWVQNYVDYVLLEGNILITDTFDKFSKKLDQAFDDPNRKKKAFKELCTLTQEKKTTVEFFTEFKVMRAKYKE